MYRDPLAGPIACSTAFIFTALLDEGKAVTNYLIVTELSSGCSDRLRDLRVGLRTTWPAKGETNLISFDKQCAVLHGTQSQRIVDITCDDGATGRYLVIQIDRNNQILTMCEVTVFGSVTGK